MSPLKLVCKNCGEVIVSMTALEMAQQIVKVKVFLEYFFHSKKSSTFQSKKLDKKSLKPKQKT